MISFVAYFNGFLLFLILKMQQPELNSLIDGDVKPAVDKVVSEHIPDVKREFVEWATGNSTSVSLPNITAVLSQPADLCMF